jgi:hypothetical protein
MWVDRHCIAYNNGQNASIDYDEHDGGEIPDQTVLAKGRRDVVDNNAFREGYDAYWAKELSADNPYPPQTEKHSSWTAGWLKAQQEDYEEDVSG